MRGVITLCILKLIWISCSMANNDARAQARLSHCITVRIGIPNCAYDPNTHIVGTSLFGSCNASSKQMHCCRLDTHISPVRSVIRLLAFLQLRGTFCSHPSAHEHQSSNHTSSRHTLFFVLMGASHSTPPPCVDVPTIYAPYGRIQVPAGSPFAIYPPPPPRRRPRPRPYPHPRRLRVDYGEEDEWESESESELDMEMPRMPRGGGFGMGMRGGMGGRGMGMGRGMEFYEEDRPRSAPGGMGYPAMAMGNSRMSGPPMGMGGGMGPPGMGGPMGMGGPGGMSGGLGDMGGRPPPDMGDMQRPGGMMGGPPQDMNGMPDLPPRYSSGPPHGQNPYAFGPQSVGSRSSATARPPRRPQGANKDIAMGAYAAPSPKISRSHTSTTTAERMHRKTAGGSGKEWIKGDDFLDACICTTNCTCREGHRVLYRSRDDGGDSDGEGRYRSGEIRYILKKDLGKDCGDHSGCKKDDSEKEEKMSKKEKKKRG